MSTDVNRSGSCASLRSCLLLEVSVLGSQHQQGLFRNDASSLSWFLPATCRPKAMPLPYVYRCQSQLCPSLFVSQGDGFSQWAVQAQRSGVPGAFRCRRADNRFDIQHRYTCWSFDEFEVSFQWLPESVPACPLLPPWFFLHNMSFLRWSDRTQHRCAYHSFLQDCFHAKLISLSHALFVSHIPLPALAIILVPHLSISAIRFPS